MNIEVLNHASIKLTGKNIIYFDPYQVKEKKNDADIIFITHDHYDHCDESSVRNVMNKNTILVVPTILEEPAKSLTDKVLVVEPNNTYKINDITFDVIPSYNKTAPYHPEDKKYVGYNVNIDGTKYYVMGDTDRTIETDNVKTDICFVPIGGTYTMNVDEAIKYINDLKPTKAIPIHYGSLVGELSLGKQFKENIDKDIQVELFIKEEEVK